MSNFEKRTGLAVGLSVLAAAAGVVALKPFSRNVDLNSEIASQLDVPGYGSTDLWPEPNDGFRIRLWFKDGREPVDCTGHYSFDHGILSTLGFQPPIKVAEDYVCVESFGLNSLPQQAPPSPEVGETQRKI